MTQAYKSPAELAAPIPDGVALTASSSAIAETRALHINTAGTITVEFAQRPGSTVDLTVLAGAIYPYRITKLTAGAGVVGLY